MAESGGGAPAQAHTPSRPAVFISYSQRDESGKSPREAAAVPPLRGPSCLAQPQRQAHITLKKSTLSPEIRRAPYYTVFRRPRAGFFFLARRSRDHGSLVLTHSDATLSQGFSGQPSHQESQHTSLPWSGSRDPDRLRSPRGRGHGREGGATRAR